jgi:hypothetical protein
VCDRHHLGRLLERRDQSADLVLRTGKVWPAETGIDHRSPDDRLDFGLAAKRHAWRIGCLDIDERWHERGEASGGLDADGLLGATVCI